MMIKEEYKKDIIQMCKKIIERNHDYDLNTMNDLDIERIGLEPNDNYVLIVNGEKISLTAFTAIYNCKYILENIDNIEYVQSSMYDEDTVVGDISNFITSTFNCNPFDTVYMNVFRQYDKFIESIGKLFTKEELINYIERNMESEIKNL